MRPQFIIGLLIFFTGMIINVYSDNILGFANNIRTIDGGTHIEGLKTVLTRTFNLSLIHI